MKTITRIFYSIHRILGTLLSILFVVWFLSGFVMIYHTFPKVFPRDRYKHLEVLQKPGLAIDSILTEISSSKNITKLELKSGDGKEYFDIITSDSAYKVTENGEAYTPSPMNYNNIESYAKKWCQADIAKVDTLYQLDQWIPFGYLKKQFPIYKFHFTDVDKHQLYVSSISGDALQFTNKSKRMWAWLGAIPHWVYFTSLRENSQLWVDVVVWLSGIGCIMCLSGIVIGVRSYYKRYRKKKKFNTPYTRFAYKWHHILGFVFGAFVFTFTFSGMMSLADVPQWIVKTYDSSIRMKQYTKNNIIIEEYKFDYRSIFETYPNEVKHIEWGTFGRKPLYKVVVENSILTIDASGDVLRPLNLTEADIKAYLSEAHTENMDIVTMSEYDNYYVGLTDHLPLPVYKVEVDDADKSTYYINPKNASVRYYNQNSKVHRWLYQGLHSYKFKFLADRPILWNIVMWTTMIGGTLVSFTGLWLSIRYIKRKTRKLKKKKDICRKEE